VCLSASLTQFNTYLELPNSELLRKYGHVDAQSLNPDIIDKLTRDALLGDWPIGNPNDEVHIDGDRILHLASIRRDNADLTDRVDWWLEEGQDECVNICQ
jgi:SET domain-containing protein 6